MVRLARYGQEAKTDHAVVAPGFASASHYVAKRRRQGITHCFEMINPKLEFEERDETGFIVYIGVASLDILREYIMSSHEKRYYC